MSATTMPTTATIAPAKAPARSTSAIRLPAVPDSGPERHEVLTALAGALVEQLDAVAALALVAMVEEQVAEGVA